MENINYEILAVVATDELNILQGDSTNEEYELEKKDAKYRVESHLKKINKLLAQ